MTIGEIMLLGGCLRDVRLWGVYFGSSLLVISLLGPPGRQLVSGQKAGQLFKDDIPAAVPFISHPNLPPPSPSPVFLQRPPGAAGDASGTREDKLQPGSLGYLPCFHLHQQLISHHWRALACQAEDFIRDVLYGL